MQAGWTVDLFSRCPKPCAEWQLSHTGASEDPRLSHLRRYLGSLVRRGHQNLGVVQAQRVTAQTAREQLLK